MENGQMETNLSINSNSNGAFQQVVSKVRRGDLDVNQKCGIIVAASFGSLVVLRDQLEREYPGFIYCTISSVPLYIVHWNDLSDKKQKEIEGSKGR